MFNSTSVGPPATKNDAALWWHDFGFTVFPLNNGQKVPAYKLKDFWLIDYSREKVKRHWEKHPTHDIGILIPENIVVIDTDGQEGTDRFRIILKSHGIEPSYVEQTRKGWHFLFRLKAGTYAPTSTDSSENCPEYIDVIGGGRQLTVSPSTGKSVVRCVATSIDGLTEIGQETIDAIFLMNGKTAPRRTEPVSRAKLISAVADIGKLEKLVDQLDPDMGHDDWVRVGMAIFHESGGSDEGYGLFDDWSSKGGSYKGQAETRMKWQSFRGDVSSPVTAGTLIKMVKDVGGDVQEALLSEFEPCETIVIEPPSVVAAVVGNPLSGFSLTGQSAVLERLASEERAILGQLALSGQITMLYAPPNSGKTLATLSLTIDAIKRGQVQARDVYYLNLDDSSKGMIEKLRIAEEYGFEMLVEGHNDFKAKDLPGILDKLIEKGLAHGKVLIVDTLKKIVDLMHKKQSSDIANIFRRFALAGGTVICLAHTNKRRGANGKLIYGGTSDFVDDSDCAYTLDLIESSVDPAIKVVEFENIKHRGNVVERAAYCYSRERDISYAELLLSVQPFDQSKLDTLKLAEQMRSDADMISIVKSCIRDGINTKMDLAVEAASRAGVSRKIAIRSIEQYTGGDPSRHHWNFSVGERGKQIFTILDE